MSIARKMRRKDLQEKFSNIVEKKYDEKRLQYLQEQHKLMGPTIEIIAPDTRKSEGDVYMGKDGRYFRISNHICALLDVQDGDYVVVGSFGSTMLIGKKPKGAFGYKLKKNNRAKANSTTGLHFHNASSIVKKGFDEGNYELEDKKPVDDKDNGVMWYKFKFSHPNKG